MKSIHGNYYFPRSSESKSATVSVVSDTVSIHYDNQCAFIVEQQNVKVSSPIPGVATEIEFDDGGRFIASDASQRLDIGSAQLEKLEKNKPLIFASIALIPLCLWFILAVGMPYVADKSVALVPQSVPEQMGKQSFNIIEELFLEPSELPEDKQAAVKKQWQDAIASLVLSQDVNYNLYVYKSEYFGPNAFALPNGTVVITDALIEKLDDKPDAILAVLLHEIGHVEGKHSLRLVAQSISNTLAIAVIFGDVDTLGEAILGTGSALVMNAFSREMEEEADDYALDHLVKLGKSPEAFGDAMSVFLDLKSQHEESDLLKYLSTHPEVKDRIKKAKEYGLFTEE
ncbi:MAG: M48 family metallopeptidase [Psychrobium sp.]